MPPLRWPSARRRVLPALLAVLAADKKPNRKKKDRDDRDDEPTEQDEENRRDEILKESFPASDPAPPPTHLS